MKQRIIFHMDINHCYAQIEEMKYPALREVPMAVGGHEEKRHGIILAKNDLAKKCGIKTGQSLRDARQLCPDLLIIPPAYDDYTYYTNLVKDIYRRYSGQVESFGLDEAWLDCTDYPNPCGDAVELAAHIQQEVLQEIGLTVSVGVSWNKAFAKLGSDMKKPSGLTVITPENYKQKVWPLPAADLLYVGPATERKLAQRGIYTIGELAEYPVSFLKEAMGVAGEMIHAFANGLDPSPVQENTVQVPVKSVGNSMTMIHDVSSLEELKPVCYVIAESVASRLRDAGMEGKVLSVFARSSGLDWYGCQRDLGRYTAVSQEITEGAMRLMQEQLCLDQPLRAFGLSLSHLRPLNGGRQLSLFRDEEAYEKERQIDAAMEEIRDRYGYYAVRRACTLMDRPLTEFNPKEDHTVHPVGYFQGRKMSLHGAL